MNLREMGCCAFNEIIDLSECDTAEAAMKEFCDSVEELVYNDNFTLVKKLNLEAFYVFTAVVKDNDGSSAGRYGHEFAAYIRKYHLGIVKETMARYNRVNEPGHLVKGWIWAPSSRALKAWWKTHKEKK